MSRSSVDPLQAAVDQACNGDSAALRDLLSRASRLPGPRPNLRLAQTAAQSLAAQMPRSRPVIDELRNHSPAQCPEGTSLEYLPMVGALATAEAAASATDARTLRKALDPLQALAEDPRRLVRSAAALAVQSSLQRSPALTIGALAAWMDGFLQAQCVLEALGESALQLPPDVASSVQARLEQVFELLQNASRADQRSHGYRALVRTVASASPKLARRFANEVTAVLVANLQCRAPEVPEAIEQAALAMRKAGVRNVDVDAMLQAVDEAKPAPRDPRSNVGPTRERAKKRR